MKEERQMETERRQTETETWNWERKGKLGNALSGAVLMGAMEVGALWPRHSRTLQENV